MSSLDQWQDRYDNLLPEDFEVCLSEDCDCKSCKRVRAIDEYYEVNGGENE